MKEALYYKKLKENVVQCRLCPHFCILKGNDIGRCRARKNIKGKLFSLSYGNLCSIAIDPIEKKPFYHFFPGEKALSIATCGCNLRCKFCQNSEISQISPEEGRSTRPEEIIKIAKENGIRIIAYTYTEPTVFYEFMLETAKLAKKEKIKNVIVSNGFINQEPLKRLCKYIDAANIDLKGISEKFYKDICEARLTPILETLKRLKKENVWTEITNLVIPSLNDKEEDVKRLISWVKENLGADAVLHFTGFYPCYKLLALPPTPLKNLVSAREMALKKGMSYVYTGNLPDDNGNNTFCLRCKKLLIKREAFAVIEKNIKNNRCIYCNNKIPGFFDERT